MFDIELYLINLSIARWLAEKIELDTVGSVIIELRYSWH